MPATFDRISSFDEIAFAWFDAGIPLQQFGRNGFGLGADVRGIAALARAIDAVFLGVSGLAADGAFGGICLDIE
jgi:hypothetical protein